MLLFCHSWLPSRSRWKLPDTLLPDKEIREISPRDGQGVKEIREVSPIPAVGWNNRCGINHLFHRFIPAINQLTCPGQAKTCPGSFCSQHRAGGWLSWAHPLVFPDDLSIIHSVVWMIRRLASFGPAARMIRSLASPPRDVPGGTATENGLRTFEMSSPGFKGLCPRRLHVGAGRCLRAPAGFLFISGLTGSARSL